MLRQVIVNNFRLGACRRSFFLFVCGRRAIKLIEWNSTEYRQEKGGIGNWKKRKDRQQQQQQQVDAQRSSSWLSSEELPCRVQRVYPKRRTLSNFFPLKKPRMFYPFFYKKKIGSQHLVSFNWVGTTSRFMFPPFLPKYIVIILLGPKK